MIVFSVMLLSSALFLDADEVPTVMVVVGAGGAEEYARQFSDWADQWKIASRKSGAKFVRIGPESRVERLEAGGWRLEIGASNPKPPASSLQPPTSSLQPPASSLPDRERLRKALQAEPKEAQAELWVVLIGHGTYDRRSAKFNLRGPDLEGEELAEWLGDFGRPVVVLDCSSSSGPFLKALSSPSRVVVTATKSGFEQNYSRFGEHLAGAIVDLAADLDKDGQTSLLEAFLSASRKTAEFYERDGRLATEHALLDDNGDGFGTPSDWFRGIRAVKRAKDGASLDGHRAHQVHLVRSEREKKVPIELRNQRDQLELQVIQLRENKKQYDESEYFAKLESLLLELALLYERMDRIVE